jgi:hypothetical protein
VAKDLLFLQASLAKLKLPLSYSPPDTVFAEGGYAEGDSHFGPFYGCLDGFFEKEVIEALVAVVNAVPDLLRRVELGERAEHEVAVWRERAWERGEQVHRTNQRLSALGVGFDERVAILKGAEDDPTSSEMLSELATLREQLAVAVRERGEFQRARDLNDGYIETTRVALGGLEKESLLQAAHRVAEKLGALQALRPRDPHRTEVKCACCGREGAPFEDGLCSWCNGATGVEMKRDEAMRVLRATSAESLLDAARRVVSEAAGVDVVRRALARLDDARRVMTIHEVRRVDALPPAEREAAIEAAAGQWRAAQEEARHWNSVATQAVDDLRVAQEEVASLRAMRDALGAAALPGAGASPEAMVAAVRNKGVADGMAIMHTVVGGVLRILATDDGVAMLLRALEEHREGRPVMLEFDLLAGDDSIAKARREGAPETTATSFGGIASDAEVSRG